jgi:hypothetical protein
MTNRCGIFDDEDNFVLVSQGMVETTHGGPTGVAMMRSLAETVSELLAQSCRRLQHV